MRCLALAQAWKVAGGESVFVVSSPSRSFKNRAARENCELISSSVSPGSGADAENVVRIAREINCRWIAVDGYCFQAEFQSSIKQSGRRVLLIDDYARLNSHCADLVLDQNFGSYKSLYPKRCAETRLLLGCSYILLRKEFTKHSALRRKSPVSAKRILITMGGSDPDKFIEFAIRALSEVYKSKAHEITVILGSQNEDRYSVERALRDCLPTAELILSSDRMSDLIANSDLAIIAAGSTLWEMMHIGCPMVSFARNDAQDQILQKLHDQGMVHYISREVMKDMQRVSEELAFIIDSRSKREQMRTFGKKLVDGMGASRVCEAMSRIN